jgi:hypothetical protein
MNNYNMILSLLYSISDYVLCNIIEGESWSYYWCSGYLVSSLCDTNLSNIHRVKTLSPSLLIPLPLLNIPIILFLVILATNLYFIIKISKELKNQINNELTKNPVLER